MFEQQNPLYEFGPFRLDPKKPGLWRNGEPVPLTHKAFETLIALVQHKGKLVEREDLMKAIWPDTFVEDGTLSFNVSVLRKVLGTDGRGEQYIQTVPRRGYRFIAEVRVIADEVNRNPSSQLDSEAKSPVHPVQNSARTTDDELIHDSHAPPFTSPASNAKNIFGWVGEHPRTSLFVGLVTVIALVLGLGSLWRKRSQSPPQTLTVKIARLTNAGQSICAAISPDGKLFAHAETRNGMQELLLTNIAHPGTSVIVPLGAFAYQSITFSNDGTYLYFTRGMPMNEELSLYSVSLPGSTPKKLIDGVDSPISLSSYGSSFSFIRRDPTNGEYSLMIANSDGSAERVITKRGNGNRISLAGAAWSSDDKTLTCGVGWWDRGYRMRLVDVSVADGHEKTLGNGEWFGISGIASRRDRTSLIVCARERASGPTQLWRVSSTDGKSERITNDVIDYGNLSVAREADAVLSVAGHCESRLWVASERNSATGREIATRLGCWSYGVSWTPHGKIVFSSLAGDNYELTQIDPDGSNQSQLTANSGDSYSPVATLDGRFIVFFSSRNGGFNIWRVNAEDGSNPRQLTFDDGNIYPSCSSDSQWVVYEKLNNATSTLWKVSINGGEPVQLTKEFSRKPVVSPNNQLIASRYMIEPGRQGIGIVPLQGSSPVKLLPIPINDWQQIQWMPNARAISYIDDVSGIPNIWSYDLATGSRKKLTDFKSDETIFSYAWSPDYKQFASMRGRELRDVAIITDQK